MRFKAAKPHPPILKPEQVLQRRGAVNVLVFIRYNPPFDHQIASNGKYELILPQEKMRLFLSTKYQILNECVQFMLGDSEVPDNLTTYPSKSKKKKAR